MTEPRDALQAARPRRQAIAAATISAVVLLSLLGDVGPTKRLMGESAGSPAFFLVPFALLVATRGPSGRLGTRWPVLPALLLLLFATATVVGLVRVALGPGTVLGEDLPLKMVKNAAAFFLWGMALWLGWVMMRRHPRVTNNAFFAALVAMVMLAIMEVAWPALLAALDPWLHSGPNLNQRPRLLFLEASIAGAAMVLTAGLVLHGSRSAARAVATVVLAMVGLVLVQSKGGLIAWTICLAAAGVAYLWQPSEHRGRKAALALLALAFVGAVAVPATLGQLSLDPGQESIETRSIYNASMATVLQGHPLGGGFGSYLLDAKDWLRQSGEMLGHPNGAANEEMQRILMQPNDESLFPKTLPVALVWIGGALGVFVALGMLALYLARLPHATPGAVVFGMAGLAVLFGFASGVEQPLIAIASGAWLSVLHRRRQ